MSKPAQSGRFSPPISRQPARRPAKALLYVLLAAVFVLVAASAYWISRKNNAGRVPERPLATSTASAATTPKEADATPDSQPTRPTTAPAAPTSTTPLTGSFTVLPARAYFHAEPDETSSTAKYVLRGDIIYAEGQSGDFIKTRYFNSDGDAVTGWLKKTDVRSSASTKTQAPRPAPATTPRRPATKPAIVAAPAEKKPPRSTEPIDNTAASKPLAATGTVRVDTTYFYDSPDLTQRRRAFCIRGDKLRLSDSSEKAVFATFVNWEKVTTTGWIRKEDLRMNK